MSMDRSGAATVSLGKLTKMYGSNRVVDEVDIDMHPGELVCLLGPSGCGKTTTLRMIAGFVEPTSGSIVIDGKDVSRLPPNQRDIGLVFQNYALFPHMTVADNITFGLRNVNWPRESRRQRVEEMLELVELSGMASRYPRELSGGQQQRVALARALALNPSVLLLDEPFSNLDAKLRVTLRENLKAILDKVQITTLFVTHDQEEAMVLADRIVVLENGRVQQEGEPRQIYKHPNNEFVANFIGMCNQFNGTLTGTTFQTDTGLTLETPQAAAQGPCAIIVRPEAIRVYAQPSASNYMKATVNKVEFYGPVVNLSLSVGETHIMAEVNSTVYRDETEGMSLPISIDVDDLRVLA